MGLRNFKGCNSPGDAHENYRLIVSVTIFSKEQDGDSV